MTVGLFCECREFLLIWELLYFVGSVSRTVVLDQIVAIMAIGSSRPEADRTGIDFQVRVQVPWNAPEACVTLDSAGLYDLDTKCVPDVLGLRARRPEAAVIKVMTGRVRVLIPDEKVVTCPSYGFSGLYLWFLGWSNISRSLNNCAMRVRNGIVGSRRAYVHSAGE